MSEQPITNNQTPITGSGGYRSSPSSPEDEDISLLDIVIILAKHKKLILGLPLVLAVIAAAYALWLPDIYTATTKLLPPQQSQSATSNLVAALSSISGLGGGKGVNEVYIAMLESRTLEDRLKQRGLMGGAKGPSKAREEPPDTVKITSDRAGLINIDVSGPEPKRAAELANAYVEELVLFTHELAVTAASQRRLFFERQVAQSKDNLAKVEVEARQALEGGGLVNVDDQGRAMMTAIGSLRGQIAVKEVQISAMHAFAADRNPDLIRVQQELDSMKRELAKMEGAGSARELGNTTASKGLSNLSLLRDLKYNETTYELLAKQYELAKIEEANDASVIQVMDKAVEPKKNSGPKRGMIVLLAVLVGMIVGIAWALIREAMTNGTGDPRQAERWRALRRYLAWR